MALVAACGSSSKNSASNTTAAAGSSSSASSAPSSSASSASASSASSAAASSAAPTSAKPSGAPIKLMTILDLTGSTAGVPENADGAQAAIDAINAKGGINGRPLTLEVCDTKTDPNQSAACGRKAVSDGVVALVGTETQVEGNYLPIVEKAGIPNIGIVPIGAPAFNSPTAFPLGAGTTASFAAQAQELFAQGATKVSLAAIDVPQAAGFAPVINLGLKCSNQKLENTVLIPSPSPDMATYVAAATRNGVDGIEVLLLAPDAVKFVQAADQAGVKAKIGMITQDPEGLIKALGPLAEGILMISDGKLLSQTTDPTVQQYMAETKAAGKPATNRGMQYGWTPVRVFQQAAAQASSITPKGIFDALSSMTNLQTGIFPPIDFTKPTTKLPLKRIFNTKVMYAKVANGQEVPITGEFVESFPC
jgi:ABC-type branched-subunit amino acid transport system substrate-binding protein